MTTIAQLTNRTLVAVGASTLVLLGFRSLLSLPPGCDPDLYATALAWRVGCISAALVALVTAASPWRRTLRPPEPVRPDCSVCATQPVFSLGDPT